MKFEVNKIEDLILEHCYNMGILKRDAEQKKKDAIIDSVIAAVVRTGLTLGDLKGLINDVNNDSVLDINIFEHGGDIKDYIKDRWYNFAKLLWRQRTVGLGTPNAASGEGELMFIFLSKKITKPTKGDILIGSSNHELKGEKIRVMGNISGKNFRKKTLKLCEKYNITPNISNRTNLESVEIEKYSHIEHWEKELSKLPLNKQKNFISDWLHCMDSKIDFDINDIFKGNLFVHDEFVKQITFILYSNMIQKDKFDKFIMLGDGSNIKILKGDLEDFKKQVNDKKITLKKDYFRINQDTKIGWYIS